MDRRYITLGPLDFPSNFEPLDDFEGLTPHEMHGLLYFPFDKEKSPLVFDPDAARDSLIEIRLVKDVTSFLQQVREGQPLKLTQKGNLPRKLCREMVAEGLVEGVMDQEWFEKNPIMKEADSYYVHFLNVLGHLAGLTRSAKGRMCLTRKAEDLVDSDSPAVLYRHLFVAYTRKVNWAYFDRYPEAWLVQAGFGFTIRLVQVHGDVPRRASFYTDKLVTAFPGVVDEFPDTGSISGRERFGWCYDARALERFLERFGLVDIHRRSDLRASDHEEVVKTDLIDRIFEWRNLHRPEVIPENDQLL